MPSLSLSLDSDGLQGNSSLTSATPSLSSSVSILFPIPSPSQSPDSAPLHGNKSSLSIIPSLSESGSNGSKHVTAVVVLD